MDTDYSKRGYLLPPGCKDLIDALKLRHQQFSPGNSRDLIDVSKLALQSDTNIWEPPPGFQGMAAKGHPMKFLGEIVIPDPISVEELAELLHQKAFRLIADFMQLGIFATIKQVVSFKAAARIASQYGFVPKRKT